MKIFDYLYYKIYRALLKSSLKDIPEIMVPVYLGVLLGINIMFVNAFLAKSDIMPFLFSNKSIAGGFGILCMLLIGLYYRKNKRKEVLKRYEQERRKQRIWGNIIVLLYVGISFLSIFAVAFYKPGKL